MNDELRAAEIMWDKIEIAVLGGIGMFATVVAWRVGRAIAIAATSLTGVAGKALDWFIMTEKRLEHIETLQQTHMARMDRVSEAVKEINERTARMEGRIGGR